MADYSELKAAIRAAIYDNTEQAITGEVLQDILVEMVDALGVPEGGIPASELTQAVQQALAAALSAYQKPATGIPAEDLAQAVRDALAAALSAYQKPAGGIPSSDLSEDVQGGLVTAQEKETWSGKQDALVSGTNIKTINGESVLGSGNLVIQGGGGLTQNDIADNLTTDDATKVLSAKQGVVLAGQVSQLGQEVNGLEITKNNMSPTGNGFVGMATMEIVDNNNSRYYSIPNNGFEKVSATVYANSNNYCAIAFYSSATPSAANFMEQSVQCEGSGNAETFADVPVPEGCLLIIISNRSSIGDAEFSVSKKGLKDDVATVEQSIDVISGKVSNIENNVLPTLATKSEVTQATTVHIDGWKNPSVILVNAGFVRPNGTESSSNDFLKSDFIDITGVKKLSIYVLLASTSCSPAVFYDENKDYINGVEASADTVSSLYTYDISVPGTAKYVKLSSRRANAVNYTIAADYDINKYLKLPDKLSVCYISPTGDDLNDGASNATPVKTLARVREILSTDGELVLLPGVYENLELDLSEFAKITGIGKVDLLYYMHKVTSADLETGYTRVYKATIPGDAINQCRILYQHGIADVNTLISANERHPLQRGQTHRVPSTRLYKAESIQEIEDTTSKQMWYFSGGTLYFSIAPGSNLADNPVIIPYNNIKATKERNIFVSNLNFFYCCLYLYGVSGELNNVSVGMTSGKSIGEAQYGAIMMNYCKALTLRNCEAYAAFYPNAGDGVNSHNVDTAISDKTFVTLIDCWLHDNSDDGESCHENCNSVHYGGLVEYNGNGVTPASGGRAQCYNTLVRRCGEYEWTQDNAGYGFTCQGTEDGPSSMECIGCVAENCVRGFNSSREGENRAINCVAKGNTISYYSTVVKINCVSLDI